MSQRIWRAVLVVSGLGFPLTQLVIRRFGRPGAVVVEVVCGGLLVRDAVLIATGVPGLLRRGPATLLWMEVAAGVAAVLTGLRPLGNADALHRAQQGRPDRCETARRAAVGTLFGLHTVRFRIYLQPGSGLKSGEPKGASTDEKTGVSAPAVDVPNQRVPAALRPGGPGLRNGNARGLGHPVERDARSGWGRQSAQLSGVPLTEMPAALAAAIALALPALSCTGDPRER